MPRWIVTAFDGLQPGQDAMIVTADAEHEAARLGAQWLQEQFNDEEPDGRGAEVLHVFVAPWDDRVAYALTLAARRSEFQCCGGGPGVGLDYLGGHWGGCPTLEASSPSPGPKGDA